MKIISKNVGLAALTTALTGAAVASGEEHYPTIAEVDAQIASISNLRGASVMWWEFEPMSGRIKDLQDKYPTQEVLRVQWHVVSNMFANCYLTCPLTNDVQINYAGMDNIIWLHLTKYKLFHANTNALMYVADCVSNALPIDVSREEEDKLAAWRLDDIADFGNTNGPLRLRVGINLGCYGVRTRACIYRYQWMRWFNSSQASFRHRVFNSFCGLILHYFSEYPEPVKRSLWEEFCRRAGASNAERAEAHSDLYRWYKIAYP